RLQEIGVQKYEISNFAKPGFESRHNMTYWSDRPYWGIGLSAHSYDPAAGPFGRRFWNTKDLRKYETEVELADVPGSQSEALQKHEAMTDFCHMFLRTKHGLSIGAAQNKFGKTAEAMRVELDHLQAEQLLEPTEDRLRLTAKGELLSNQVFERLT